MPLNRLLPVLSKQFYKTAAILAAVLAIQIVVWPVPRVETTALLHYFAIETKLGGVYYVTLNPLTYGYVTGIRNGDTIWVAKLPGQKTVLDTVRGTTTIFVQKS